MPAHGQTRYKVEKRCGGEGGLVGEEGKRVRGEEKDG